MTSESNANQVPMSLEDSLPGAFPETPADESGPVHNKLHKRDDPRGWTDSNQTPRNHEYTDSGVSGVNPSNSNPQSKNYTYEKGGLNDPTSRAQDHTIPSVAKPQTGETPRPHISYDHDVAKPGVMTGAYSRVGNNSNQPGTLDNSGTRQAINANAPSSNTYNQKDTSTIPEKAPRPNDNHVHIKGAAPTAVAGGAAAASTTHQDGSSNSQAEEGQQRNLVRNGRGRSEIDHEEAYWGDIPRGAGVYNTVVGTGSGEKNPATQHKRDRTLPHTGAAQHLAARDGTAASNPDPAWHNEGVEAGNGVHNSVIGTGSNEDRSAIHHQRAFPLVASHDDDAHATSAESATHQSVGAGVGGGPPSRFHEDLAEAGAGTHDYAQGREGNPTAGSGITSSQKHLSDTPMSQPEEKNHSQHHLGRDAALAGAGATAAGYGAHKYGSSRDDEKHTLQQRQQQDASSTPGVGQNTTYRDYAPAATGAASSYGTHNSSSSIGRDVNTTTTGYNNNKPSSYAQKDLSSVPETDTTRGNGDSHFGRNAALAGAGVGAAGYGGYKYAHHDDDDGNNAAAKTHSQKTQPQPQHATTTTTSTTRSQPTVTSTTTTDTSRKTRDVDARDDTHHHSDAKNAAAGTAAGAAAAAAWNGQGDRSTTDSYQQQQQHPSTTSRTTDSYEQSPASAREDNHTGAKIAATTATLGGGAGAGALAYREKENNNTTTTTTKTSPIRGSTVATASHGDGKYKNPNASTTSHSSTDSSKGGQYNVLSSGTPSGINISGDAHPHSHDTPQSLLEKRGEEAAPARYQ